MQLNRAQWIFKWEKKKVKVGLKVSLIYLRFLFKIYWSYYFLNFKLTKILKNSLNCYRRRLKTPPCAGLNNIVCIFGGNKKRGQRLKAAYVLRLPQLSGDVEARTASCALVGMETMRHACHSIQDTRPEQAKFGYFSGSDVAELICSAQPERNPWPVKVWITRSRKGGRRNAAGISAVGERSQVLAANQTWRKGNHRNGSRAATDVEVDLFIRESHECTPHVLLLSLVFEETEQFL